MPKELFEINTFESGNIYIPDDRDIPDDAAAYGENIDPYGQAGSLQAVQEDATAILASVDAKRMAMINDEGTYRMVYVDNSDGDIKSIADVYAGSPSITSLEAGSFGAGEIAALQTNNKEVHMGLGKTRDPKWAGIIPHGQFGGNAPAGLQIENSELVSPSPFPNMHTIVNNTNNTYAYGIQLNGNYIYKFDVTKGVLVRRSEHYFTKTRAMCLASDGNLWIADEASSNLTILKIDPDNMDTITSRPLNHFAGDTSVTDIMQCGTTLWLASGNVDTTSNYLWNIGTADLTTSSSASTAVSRTPYKGADATSTSPNTGDWGIHSSDTTTTAPNFTLPKLPLVRVTGSDSYVGIVVRPVLDPASNKVRWYYGSGSSYIGHDGSTSNAANVKGEVKYFLQVVKYNITANDKLGDLANKGLVYAFSSDFNEVYGDVYLTKQDTNSTYLNWAEKGSSASQTTLHRLTKVAYNHTQASIVGGSRSAVGTNLDLDDGVLDETGNSYNVFSGANQVRWAAGASGSLSIKAEGEFVLTISNNANVDGSIDASHDHFYATSFTYDGYQESPLSSWTHIDNGSISEDSLNVKIDLYKANLSKRVTHINLYRSSATDGNATQPSGFFRLVKSISLKSGWLATDSDTSNPDWGNYYTKTIVDTGTSYASYESNTGISEALLNTLPKYGLSTKVNNYLYIADCSHIDIDNATNYLFKSRPFNFDQFNWARDFLLLPSKPVALESFNGRLYAFSENSIYVINPDGMYIEDTLEGIGCRNQNSVVVSDIGMCWMDNNSIYYYDGQSINDIAQPIKYAEQTDNSEALYSSMEYLTALSSSHYYGDIVAAYDGYRKSFYFFYTRKSSSQYFPHTLVYTVPKNRWDVWTRANGLSSGYGTFEVYGSTIGKNNEVLISDTEHGLIQPFDPKNSTRKTNFEWYSKKFTMGDSTVDKKFFKVEALSEDSTPTITVNTAENSSTYAALNTPTKSRHIQVRIFVSDSTSIVDAIRIVYRKLRRTKAMS